MKTDNQKTINLIICRGGGDLASGIVHGLVNANYPVLILEREAPTAIRRQVAFSSALTQAAFTVEGKVAVKSDEAHFREVIADGKIPVVVDPEGDLIGSLRPQVVIDAILAKKNLGTSKDMADLVIGIGPGFTAGKDVDYVVETMRGHGLGDIIKEGQAYPDTGVPGDVGGFTRERVCHAPAAGMLRIVKDLGEKVEAGEEIARIYQDEDNFAPVCSEIQGFVRGMFEDGRYVPQGMKIADVDPRLEEISNYKKITDKARKLGESVCKLVAAYEEGRLPL